MPRYLSWDAQNETKLFHAILAVHSIKIDYDAVAKIFGPEVPASCIKSHVKHLRQKATAMGIIASKSTPPSRAVGRATGNASKKTGKAKEATDDTDEDDEGQDGASIFSKTLVDEDSDHDGITKIKPDLSLSQRKTIGGRITKLRSSPRKTPRPDYKALLDAFSADEDSISEEGKSGLDKKKPSDTVYNANTVEEVIRVKAEI